MLLSTLMNETVTLRKKDGQTRSFKAMVQPNMIFTDDSDLPVEEGDLIERKLPNGMAEGFVVTERGYTKGMRNIPDHYQIKTRKAEATDSPTSRQPSVPTHIYNVTGPHARVNIQSEDSSINISSVSNEQLYDDRAHVIEQQVASAVQRADLLNRLEALESAPDKITWGEKYREFIASAADHMTLLAPFLPALTSLFAGMK